MDDDLFARNNPGVIFPYDSSSDEDETTYHSLEDALNHITEHMDQSDSSVQFDC